MGGTAPSSHRCVSGHPVKWPRDMQRDARVGRAARWPCTGKGMAAASMLRGTHRAEDGVLWHHHPLAKGRPLAPFHTQGTGQWGAGGVGHVGSNRAGPIEAVNSSGSSTALHSTPLSGPALCSQNHCPIPGALCPTSCRPNVLLLSRERKLDTRSRVRDPGGGDVMGRRATTPCCQSPSVHRGCPLCPPSHHRLLCPCASTAACQPPAPTPVHKERNKV